MPYTDQQLTCSDCGADFTFSSGEQERYAQLGFANEPKRCSSCRAGKKALRIEPGGASRDSGIPGPMFPAVCTACGKTAEVPFEPKGKPPVYCSDCFTRRS